MSMQTKSPFALARSPRDRDRAARSSVRGHCLSIGLVIATVFGATLPASRTHAQSVDLCVHQMSEEQIEDQTQQIVGALRSNRRHARAWRFGWLAAYAGIAAVSLGVLMPGIDRNTTDQDDRARRLGYIGAGSAASLAAARLAFYPMPDVWGVRRIERMPSNTREERVARLRYAERVLDRAGSWQRLMTGSTSYALAIGWGVAWGTALTVKYDNPLSSALAFLGSPILGIATVLTAPNWAALRSAELRGGVCGHAYVEDTEDPMGGPMEEEYDPEEDDWEDPGMGDEAEEPLAEPDESTESASGPSVMVYPTFGGAGMFVSF